MKMTGAKIVMECLLEQQVDTVFGYPGGTILNLYDELYNYRDRITHIRTAHEQGAAHAADGYARSSHDLKTPEPDLGDIEKLVDMIDASEKPLLICGGGIVDLMQCGFEVLCEAGYAPENAYFECIHEMKLIIDLINKGGIAAMNYSISDTAEFGEYVSGPRVLPHDMVKANMRAILSDIQDGTFAGRWIAENKNGRTFFNSKRDQLARHPMEVIGKELRDNMLWKDSQEGDKGLDSASN